MNKTENTIEEKINKYHNSKIYKLVDNTNGKIYVGSTTQALSKRKGGHVQDYKRKQDGKRTKGCSSFDIIKNNDYDIVLIENVKVENKEQLFQKEREYIEKLDCINKTMPCRTKEECKQQGLKARTKYKEIHADKIKESAKRYRQKNKELIRAIQKQYRENNKEKIQEQRKKYESNNKEKIRERKRKNYQEKKAEQQKAEIIKPIAN